MAVIGEELEGYVVNQINARQTLHGSGVGHTGNLRTPQQINLLNSNTSWIKLASGVSISGSNRLTELGLSTSLIGMELAKNNILFSGTSKLINGQLEQKEGFLPRDTNSSYTYGSFGFSPMPGIHSADIKTLTRGSLKKATVKLTANNKQQFDIIDLLYMRLGYTVLLEWGNSIYTTTGFNKQTLGNTLIEDKFFESSGNDSYFTFLEDIENKRDKHDGNYDALLGKISNFNWSFNSDGSYSIELTIISLGDVIESLKSNLSVDKVTNEFLNLIIPASTNPPIVDSFVQTGTSTPLDSTMLFGGAKVKIPSAGSHAGQTGWQSGNAWDIFTPIGTPVYAVAAGTLKSFNDYGPDIIYVDGKKLFGISYTVKSDGKGVPSIYYAHLKNSPLKKGQHISCGQLVGYVMDFPGGSSHLHIGVETGNVKQFINDDGKGTLKCPI